MKQMIKNKKGFAGDVIIASAALLAVVLVIATVSMILYNFNTEIQSQTMPEAAKQASAYSEAKFPTILGYGFAAMFFGFVIYTLVTSVLINNIHPIFWIVGFVIVFISTIISTSFKLAYGVLETVSALAPYLAGIPGANWYFTGLEIYNVIWMGIQLTIIYFAWER